jgi:hypothetical protein
MFSVGHISLIAVSFTDDFESAETLEPRYGRPKKVSKYRQMDR